MPKKLIPDSEVEQLMRAGKTDAQILEILERDHHITVTRQALSAWRKRRGLDARPQVTGAVPWTLRPEHRNSEMAKVLRWHARDKAGLTLRDDERYRMQRVAAILDERDAVLWYDPASEDGWVLVPRRKGVDTGLVHEG